MTYSKTYLSVILFIGFSCAVSFGQDAPPTAVSLDDLSSTSTLADSDTRDNDSDGAITITEEDLKAFMKEEGSSQDSTSSPNKRSGVRPNAYQRAPASRSQRDELSLPSGELQIKVLNIDSNDKRSIASCELTNASDSELYYWKLGAYFRKSFSKELGYDDAWGFYLKPQATVPSGLRSTTRKRFQARVPSKSNRGWKRFECLSTRSSIMSQKVSN